jgi:hypothetical protein
VLCLRAALPFAALAGVEAAVPFSGWSSERARKRDM